MVRGLLLASCPRLFARWARPDDRELGELGERLAARGLAARGWRLLGRRVRTPHGELDLVLLRGAQLLAVEVKASRAAAPGRFRPADRHRSGARRRQRRAAAWLRLRLRHPGPVHLALCEVFLAAPGGRPTLALHSLAPPTGFSPGRPAGR